MRSVVKIFLLVIVFCFCGCTLLMPLPTDISNTKLDLNYKYKSIEIRDERKSIDTSDIVTPRISFSKKIIKTSPPFKSSQKDTIEFLLKKQLSQGLTEVDVIVHFTDGYKEFSVIPLEDMEQAKCSVNFTIDLKFENQIKTSFANAEYFVKVKDVNDKGFEKLYIITIKNCIQTCLKGFK